MSAICKVSDLITWRSSSCKDYWHWL